MASSTHSNGNNFQMVPGDEYMPHEPERPDAIEQSGPTECATIVKSSENIPANPWTREMLQAAAQNLIDDINAKRKRDTTLLSDFKKNMELQIEKSCGTLEQAMYQSYEHNGKQIEGKLQELFATLERISNLETELQQFKHALSVLYKDIHMDNQPLKG